MGFSDQRSQKSAGHLNTNYFTCQPLTVNHPEHLTLTVALIGYSEPKNHTLIAAYGKWSITKYDFLIKIE
jgi:hypothetical protein